MEPGRCPSCARIYTSGEVLGLGILRPRPAADGGPLMEFVCPGCGRRIVLVPHGGGRYAPPGEPPPAAVPDAQRRPPWMGREAPRTKKTAPPPQKATPPPQRPPEPSPRPPPWEEPVPRPSFARALEILGIGPEADLPTIEGAFRERSQTCHPDKVAHLDLEFQALAERKFRELKAAYDLLMGRFPGSSGT